MSEPKQFDAAEYLDTPKLISAYLTEAIEAGDQSSMRRAIKTIERALERWVPPQS